VPHETSCWSPGLGVVTPRRGLLEAARPWRQRCRPFTKFDASLFPSQIAAEVKDFDAEKYLPRRDIVRTDPFIHFALTAALEALQDSKLEPSSGDPRMGISIGTSMGGLPLILTTYDGLLREQMRGVDPYAMPGVK
jgi:3-oxoacyl-[acyl-carrier-protein] synthase II